jgi:hypothetical protein
MQPHKQVRVIGHSINFEQFALFAPHDATDVVLQAQASSPKRSKAAALLC